MSTRSANNKRTQAAQSGEMTGYTRKSAGTAKPARAAASSVRVVPASSKAKRQQLERGESLEGLTRAEKRERRAERRAMEDRVYSVSNELMKEDPEYNRRRRFFWGFLGVGLVATLVVWVLMFAIEGNDHATVAQMVGLVIAYASIIGAFIYDLVRIRPIRNEARTKAEGMSDKKQVDLLEKAAAKRDAERREREAKKKKK